MKALVQHHRILFMPLGSCSSRPPVVADLLPNNLHGISVCLHEWTIIFRNFAGSTGTPCLEPGCYLLDSYKPDLLPSLSWIAVSLKKRWKVCLPWRGCQGDTPVLKAVPDEERKYLLLKKHSWIRVVVLYSVKQVVWLEREHRGIPSPSLPQIVLHPALAFLQSNLLLKLSFQSFAWTIFLKCSKLWSMFLMMFSILTEH